MGTTTLSGGNKVATVALGTNLTVNKFGAFGSGASPSDPAELDTLHFVGAGLTAASMVLTQNGTDVVITFAGIANTKVTLVDTAISALENITGQGNFRFDGESQVSESIDVWNDTRVTGTVAHDNSVTYLNALNDTATGRDSSNDVIRGLDGNDVIKGLGGDDRLYGNAGDDRLNGGAGADQMVGGRGNDTYQVDDLGDKVVETLAGPDGGIDTVVSSVDFTLGANVENLTLTNPFGSTGIGNGLDNVITGGQGGSWLIGNGGNDTLQGMSGYDTLEGGAGDDTLRSGGGPDILDGGTGNDLMVGGAGEDTYYVDSVGDRVVETLSNQDGGGIDIVNSAIDYTLGANLDFLVLTGQAVSGTGNASYNFIQGDDLANFLSGKGGDDNLFGMKGDDVLAGGAGNDAEHGGNGADALSGDNGDDSLVGEAGNDFLQGGIGNDSLDGGTGNDTMSGDAGNDTYYVDSIGDKVIETLTAAAGGGIDTVISSINYTLGINVENLQLDGGLTGTGNSLDNTITGTSAAETLKGDGGNDRLVGGGGADSLFGEDGNDTLVLGNAQIKSANGGTGIDTLDVSALGTIDLTGALSTALKSIEIVSLSSSPFGGHNLFLDSKAVDSLAAGGAFGDHTLLVTGGINDSVTLDATWTAVGSLTNPFGQAGTFNEFTSGDATLLVESEVAATGGGGSTPTLGGLNGGNGFRVDGPGIGNTGDHWVSNIGDFNGDGFDDLVLGGAVPNEPSRAAIVLGHAGGFPAILDVDSMTAADGFLVPGFGAQFGRAVGSAGDVNGDGFDDLVVGDPQGNGSAFVLFGQAATPSEFTPPLKGFEIDGANPGDSAGISVAAAGDVNGDGYADVIIGAPAADPNGVFSAGSAYVVLGQAGGFDPTINVATLDGVNGFALNGATADGAFGSSVASAGDINGDGYADMMIASRIATAVVFGHGGPLPANVDLGKLDGSNGFLVNGGGTVSSAGDVNGDGIADLIIGNGVAVVFGHAGAFSPTVTTASLDGSNGFTFVQSGLSVSGAGDVNGDGFADVLVGDALANGTAGTAYVVFGHAGGFENHLDLTKLTLEQGFQLHGINGRDYSGDVVSTAGDVNGDGYADIAIAAPGANGAGLTYVVFGGNFTGAVYPYDVGSGAAEAFVGSAGNDVIYGGGGKDSFESGAGDDQIYIGSGDFRHIDGGGGIDTVFLDGAIPVLDLTGDLRGRITNIESISLYGEGANVLKLDPTSVEAILGSNGAAGDGPRTLVITGDDSDTVELEGQWQEIKSGNYQTFVSGGITVEVTPHLHVEGALPTLPDLGSLDGDNGFIINTPNGGAVAGAGDFNGDGYQDIVLGTVGNNFGAIEFGHGGTFDPYPRPGDRGSELFTLTLPHSHSPAGAWAVAGLGDVNGDGYDDVILTDPFHNDIQFEGLGCVVFGSATGINTTQDLSALDGKNGFQIEGTIGAELGWSAAAGDINGDGFADIIVGSYNAFNAPGAAYVIFGHAGAFSAEMTPADLKGTNGFMLTGASALVAHAVTSGDINGDGFADLIVSGRGGSKGFGYSGESYVLFGHAGSFGASIDVGTLDGPTGFKIAPIFVGDDSGMLVPGVTNIASAGDLNGDGYDDIVVGVYAADPSGRFNAGSTYVVFGHGGGFASTLDLATLDPSHGFRIDGAVDHDSSGWSVAGAGDFNGDGYADLLVSAHVPTSSLGGGGNVGSAYLFYGHAGGFGDIDLSHLSPAQGFELSPAPPSIGFGMTVAAAGDVNGDGFADIAISDYATGATYVVFGGNFTGSVDHLGTAQSDTLTGTLAAETFVGGDGKDVIYGGGGADSIEGGAGSDVIHVAFAPPAGESYTDTNHNNQYDPGEPFADYNQNGVHDGPSTGSDVFRHVDGGSGFDFLYLDAGGALDFSNLDGNPTTSNRGKISNIESLNFNNGFQNDVTLHKADVLDMHPSDDHLATLSTPEHVLYLHGDANDTLHLATSDHWTLQAPGTIPGYAVYASDEVKIAVEGMAVHVDLPN